MRVTRHHFAAAAAFLVLPSLLNPAQAAAPAPLWDVAIAGYADKPTVGDLDGDGRFEVVLATDQGVVQVLNGRDGTELWRREFDDETFVSTPIVADVNRDGGAEIIVVGMRNGLIACLSGVNGATRWEKKTRDGIGGSPALIDRPAPAAPLLVVAQDTRLRTFDATTGENGWEASLPQDSQGSVGIGRPDGGERILIGTRRGRGLAFDLDGNKLWETSLAGGINAAPLVVDADNDGTDELLFLGAALYCLDREGKERWRWSAPKGAGLASSLAVFDVNDDGKQEILLTAYDGGLYAVSAAGKTVWNAAVTTPTAGAVNAVPASTPALVDTKGTLKGADAVLASPDPGAPGLVGFDGKTGKRLWRVPMQKFSQCCPVVADLTSDGRPEVVATDAAGRAYAWSLGNAVKRGWPRFGSTLYGASTDTERRRQSELLLAGQTPFATSPREIGPLAPAEPGLQVASTGLPPLEGGTAQPVQTDPAPPVIAPTDPGPLVPPVTIEPAEPAVTVEPVQPAEPVSPPTSPEPPRTDPTTTTVYERPLNAVETRPASEIAVRLDSYWLGLDPAPVMVGGRVLVPLRGIFQAFNAKVDYDGPTKRITAARGVRRVELTVGSKDARVDGTPVTLDVPAQLIDGSTYVPLRFVGQALGGTVFWHPEDSEVELFSPKVTR